MTNSITELQERIRRLHLENQAHADFMAHELAKAKAETITWRKIAESNRKELKTVWAMYENSKVYNIDNPQKPDPASGFSLLGY